MSITFDHIKPKQICPRPGANHEECHSCIQACWCSMAGRSMAEIIGESTWRTNMIKRWHQETFILNLTRILVKKCL
jgi:hypothetical protein